MASSFPAVPRGGVLLGLGTDLVEVARIREVYERQGERFLAKVFSDEEIAYAKSQADPVKHLAVRFAAKEAASKAFGTGIGAELGWKSISVYHGPRSEPRLRLDEQGEAFLKHLGGTELLVSLTHTETTALAVVVIIKAVT